MASLRPTLLFFLVLLALAARASEAPHAREFGAGLKLAQTTELAAVLADPEAHAKAPVLIEGRLTDLCTKKGCWTVLADGAAAVRVRFHDYGFFLPQDALGARALVEGVAEVRTLSEREARHYAGESRDGDPEAIQGPSARWASSPRACGCCPAKASSRRRPRASRAQCSCDSRVVLDSRPLWPVRSTASPRSEGKTVASLS